MSRALIDEHPILLLPTLVKAVGFAKATILQQLHWLLNQPRSGVEVDAEKYAYGTYDEWCRDFFPFWEPRTLRRHMTELEKDGLVLSCKPKAAKDWDHTKHYRLGYGALEQLLARQIPATSMWPKQATSEGHQEATSMWPKQATSLYGTETSTDTSTDKGEVEKSAKGTKRQDVDTYLSDALSIYREVKRPEWVNHRGLTGTDKTNLKKLLEYFDNDPATALGALRSALSEMKAQDWTAAPLSLANLASNDKLIRNAEKAQSQAEAHPSPAPGQIWRTWDMDQFLVQRVDAGVCYGVHKDKLGVKTETHLPAQQLVKYERTLAN